MLRASPGSSQSKYKKDGSMASQKLQETTSYYGLLAKHRLAPLALAMTLAPTLISA
jgi:hypothetical protein